MYILCCHVPTRACPYIGISSLRRLFWWCFSHYSVKSIVAQTSRISTCTCRGFLFLLFFFSQLFFFSLEELFWKRQVFSLSLSLSRERERKKEKEISRRRQNISFLCRKNIFITSQKEESQSLVSISHIIVIALCCCCCCCCVLLAKYAKTTTKRCLSWY